MQAYTVYEPWAQYDEIPPFVRAIHDDEFALKRLHPGHIMRIIDLRNPRKVEQELKQQEERAAYQGLRKYI